jgi:hypothetical protein
MVLKLVVGMSSTSRDVQVREKEGSIGKAKWVSIETSLFILGYIKSMRVGPKMGYIKKYIKDRRTCMGR